MKPPPLVGSLLVLACAVAIGTVLAAQDAALLVLDRPIHFTTADGSDTTISSGTYSIEQEGTTTLRLQAEDGSTVDLQAVTIKHDESLSEPTSLAITEEGREDELHIVLLLPDGQALEALGSYSGLTTRGLSSPILRRLNSAQLAAARSRTKPLAVPSHTVTNPTIVRVPAAPAPTVGTTVNSPKSVKLGPGKWISWTYLQMHHPELVAQALADVQAGKRPRSFLAGLATPMELDTMLKTNWAMEASRLNAALQTTVKARGLISAMTEAPSIASSAQQSQPTPPLMQRELSSTLLPLLPLPTQDLGAAFSGEHPTRTFSVTSPVDGWLTAALDIKSARDLRFRIDKAITYKGEFVNGAPQVSEVANGGDWNDIRLSGEDPSVRVSMAGYVTINVKAHQRVHITVAFAPHTSIGPPAGKYEVPLKLVWHARSNTKPVGFQTVPLRAYCNGINFGLIAYAEQSAVVTLTDRSVDYPVVLTNAGATPISGSFSPQQLPPGVIMNPMSLSIAPHSSQRATLQFNVNSQGAQDGPNQDISVTFNYGGRSRPINLSLSIYHPWIWWCSVSGNRPVSCGDVPGTPGVELGDSFSYPVGGSASVQQLQAWIKADGQWWWKIDTYNSKSVDVGGTDFKAVLSFTANPVVSDTINVHIGPSTMHQHYEHLMPPHPWISNNFLTAAQTGVTIDQQY